jgi:hypothetical protein
MTADPTGTVGAPRQAEADFGLVLKGGAAFAARLQQLADARAEHDAAFERLRLGKTAQAAFTEAQRKLEAAAVTLANAKREAADILAVADRERASAEELRRNAREQVRAATAAADEARQATAKAEAARLKAEAAEKKFNDKIARLKTELAKVA